MYLLNCFATFSFLALPHLGDWAKKGIVSLASVAFVLGVLVFVHELGHFMVAKLCGVRVEVFSLGFGKRLWGMRRGDTDYRVSILPLGGYVKMTGENPLEAGGYIGEEPAWEQRNADPGAFTSHPRWQRFLIAIAGPAMNIVLAVVVLTGVYMAHDEEPAYPIRPAVVGAVDPGSPAEKAGIKPGDVITQIHKTDNPSWDQVSPEILINPGQPVAVTIQRGGQTIHTQVVPQAEGPDRSGEAGWTPQLPVLVGKMDQNLPAAKAGIKTGDLIVSLNGKPVQGMAQFIDLLQQVKAAPVELGVRRSAAELSFTVTPRLADDGTGTGAKRYRIGFQTQDSRVQQLPFRAAFRKSAATTKEYSLLLFRLVPRLLEAKNSIRQMSGPVGIMQASGQMAMEGWPTLLAFMAMLSVSLAVLNILPFPILDGGLMAMLLIEGVIRRDIKVEIKERLYYAAFVCLVLFAAVVTYFDVAKSFHG